MATIGSDWTLVSGIQGDYYYYYYLSRNAILAQQCCIQGDNKVDMLLLKGETLNSR